MRHDVALWAGITSFFGSILAIITIDILNPDHALQLVGAVIVGILTAGGVYAQQRLVDARLARRLEDRAAESTGHAGSDKESS